MRKKSLKKLVLSSETLCTLTQVKGAGGFDLRRDTGPDDETCYWGCTFTCPDNTGNDAGVV